MDNIGLGLDLLFSGTTPLFVLLGLILGFVVGVLPGFSGANATALALPFSVILPLEQGLILMAGIYAGASFAGAVPAILVNVPGTAGAAATAMDGYPMTQQGKAGLAIGIARTASTLGGVIGMMIIIPMIGPAASLALNFGSPEMFFVALLGLLIIGTVISKDVKKGLLSGLLGVLLAALSASPVTGRPRFTMGFLELYDEVPFVPAIIGLFAFAQMYSLATQDSLIKDKATMANIAKGKALIKETFDGIKLTFSYPITVVRASLVGILTGLVPGAGTTAANFISYALAQRGSKDPDSFGKGNPEGIIASESCDNAVTGSTLVPTFALGIPGSGTAAIMLAALYLNGVQPGPRIMQTHPGELYAVLLSMLLAAILILPVGILLATPLVQITRARPAILVPAILITASVGTFAVRNQMFDVALAGVFGVLGFILVRNNYPVVPLVLGLILGPIAENNFMRSLNLAGGDPTYFMESTTSKVLIALNLTVLISMIVKELRARGERRQQIEQGLDPTETTKP